MIELRLARPEELDRQKELWRLAFGDGGAYIDHYFSRLSEMGGEMVVLLDDDVLCSMVGLLPVEVALPDGTVLPSAYIYALATHPDARGKGHASTVLKYVDFYLQEKGLKCVTIVPAEVSLHRFFESNGFLECFSTRKCELLDHMMGKADPADSLVPVSHEEYGQLRESLLEGSFHVRYPQGLLAYQQGVSHMMNCHLYRMEVDGVTGCAAGELLNDDTLLLKEFLVPPQAMKRAVALIGREVPTLRYHIRSTCAWAGPQGNYVQNFGMIKWYDQALDKAWYGEHRGYLGLAFD